MAIAVQAAVEWDAESLWHIPSSRIAIYKIDLVLAF